jgi:hypothetical protein
MHLIKPTCTNKRGTNTKEEEEEDSIGVLLLCNQCLVKDLKQYM